MEFHSANSKDSSISQATHKLERDFATVCLPDMLSWLDLGKYSLIITAAHSVLLDSGFVAFYPDSSSATTGLDLSCSNILFYTLPKLLVHNKFDTVMLEYTLIEETISVRGSLVAAENGYRSLIIDEQFDSEQLIRTYDSICLIRKFDHLDGLLEEELMLVYDLRVKLEDDIVRPLLIEMYEKNRLPCFMHLPSELKFKILELLPSEDLARVAHVCSKLKELVSISDGLWKQRFEEEFMVNANWKKMYGEYRSKRKRDEEEGTVRWKRTRRGGLEIELNIVAPWLGRKRTRHGGLEIELDICPFVGIERGPDKD